MAGTRGRVLVVEDDPDVRDLVRINLEASGFDVATADDGAAGLTQARGSRPDLVLLDVMMPVLDGWQTLRALKEHDDLRDVPVVMLTALGAERDVINGTLNGAVEYVTKPFDARDLVAVVERAVVPAGAEELERRHQRTKDLLRRLAEIDSGRAAEGRGVRWDRLEQVREPVAEPVAEPLDASAVDGLTPKQRYVAVQMARGHSARQLSEELDVSRSNIYATRKRIGRKLGVAPDAVPTVARELGLHELEVRRPPPATTA